jgi:hypothetical protein
MSTEPIQQRLSLHRKQTLHAEYTAYVGVCVFVRQDSHALAQQSIPRQVSFTVPS